MALYQTLGSYKFKLAVANPYVSLIRTICLLSSKEIFSPDYKSKFNVRELTQTLLLFIWSNFKFNSETDNQVRFFTSTGETNFYRRRKSNLIKK